MLSLLIIALRFLFLFTLVFILFKMVKWMIADLRGLAEGDHRAPDVSDAAREPETPDKSILVALDSDIQELEEGDSFVCSHGELLIGRSDDCDVVITAAYASARHARLYFQAGQFWLEDLHSTNGTYINGRQVNSPVVLANGDRIRIGGVTFQYVRWAYEMGADHR